MGAGTVGNATDRRLGCGRRADRAIRRRIDAVKNSLANGDEIVDQSDGKYIWLEAVGDLHRNIGTITVEDGRLVIETNSQKRAEKARDWLSSRMGDAVRFRAISYEDIGQALKRAPAPPTRRKSEVPLEVQAEVLGKFYDEHYHRWLNEPVPAFGNRTPRHAARLKTIRPKVIALLKDIESRAERQRRAGNPPMIQFGCGRN